MLSFIREHPWDRHFTGLDSFCNSRDPICIPVPYKWHQYCVIVTSVTFALGNWIYWAMNMILIKYSFNVMAWCRTASSHNLNQCWQEASGILCGTISWKVHTICPQNTHEKNIFKILLHFQWTKSWYLADTVRPVIAWPIFSKIHNRHTLLRQWGRYVSCLFWVENLFHVLTLFW